MSQTFYRRISGKNPLESLYLLPLEEEDDVHRQVRDHDIADIAADFEPLRL